MARDPGISTHHATREGDGDDDSNEQPPPPTRSTASRESPTSGGRSARWSAGTSIKAAAEQTDGRLIQMVVRDSRGAGTPLHIHHDADESFYVIEARSTSTSATSGTRRGAGDYVFAPMGVPHAFVVTSEQAELFVTFAGAGTEGPLGAGVHGFFSEVGTPVAAGDRARRSPACRTSPSSPA